MRKINAKKGDLVLSNVLEIILAVICIGLIIYFVYYLYQQTVNQEKNNAIQIIDTLSAQINNLEPGNVQRLTIRSPCTGSSCNWFLEAFSSISPDKPAKCYDQSCVCACKESRLACQANGYCKPLTTSSIVIEGEYNGNIVQSALPFGSDLTTLEAVKMKDDGVKLTLIRGN